MRGSASGQLLISVLICVIAGTNCTKATKDKTDTRSEGGIETPAPTPMALSRNEAIAQVVENLRTAGLGDADLATAKAAMEQAGASFGLQDATTLSAMLAAMAQAAVGSLGDMTAAQGNPALKQRAIAGVAKGFVGYLSTKGATAEGIASSVKELTHAVTQSLITAKVSDAELQAVLQATTEAAIGAMMQSELVKKGNVASLLGSAASGLADGLAAAGFSAEAVVASIGGITAAAVKAGAANGVPLNDIGNLAKTVTQSVVSAFAGKAVDHDALAANLIAGVEAGANMANLPAETVSKIVAEAATATPTVKVDELPPFEYHQGSGKVAALEREIQTKANSLNIKLVATNSVTVSGPGYGWDLIAPNPPAVAEATFKAAKGFNKYRWAWLTAAQYWSTDDNDYEEQPKEDEDFYGLRAKKGKQHKLVKRLDAARVKRRQRSEAVSELTTIKWSEWLPFSDITTVSLVGKAEDQYYVMVEVANDAADVYRSRTEVTIDRTAPTLSLMTPSEYESYLDDLSEDDEEVAPEESDEGNGVEMPELFFVSGYESVSVRYVVVADPNGTATCAGVTMPNYYANHDDRLNDFVSMPATSSAYVTKWEDKYYAYDALFNSKPYLICADGRDAAGNVTATRAFKRYTPVMKGNFALLDAGPTTLTLDQGSAFIEADGLGDMASGSSASFDYVIDGSDTVTIYKRNASNGSVTGPVTAFDGSTPADWDGWRSAMLVSGANIYVAIAGSKGVVVASSTDEGATWTNRQITTSESVKEITPALALSGTSLYVFYMESSGDQGEDSVLKQGKASTSNLSSWATSQVRLYPEITDFSLAAGASGSNVYVTVVPGWGDAPLFVEHSSNGGSSYTMDDVITPYVKNVRNVDVVLDSLWVSSVSVSVSSTHAVIFTDGVVFNKVHASNIWTAAGLPDALFKNGDSFPPPPPADDGEDGEGDDDETSEDDSISIGYAHDTDEADLYGNLQFVSGVYTGSALKVFFRSSSTSAGDVLLATSTDMGANWTSKRAGNDTEEAVGMYADATSARLIYRDRFGTKTRVFSTSDSGSTWNTTPAVKTLAGQILAPEYGQSCCEMYGAARNGQTIMALAANNSLYQSANGGTDWKLTRLSDAMSNGRLLAVNGKFILAAPGWFGESADGLTWYGHLADEPAGNDVMVDLMFAADTGSNVVSQVYRIEAWGSGEKTLKVVQYEVGSEDDITASVITTTTGDLPNVIPAYGAAYGRVEVAGDGGDPEVYTLEFKRLAADNDPVGNAVTLVEDGAYNIHSMVLVDSSAGLFAQDGSSFLLHNGASWSAAGTIPDAGAYTTDTIVADGKPWLVQQTPGSGLVLLRTSDMGATWTGTTVDAFDAAMGASLIHDGTSLELFYQSRYGLGIHYDASADDGASF